MRRRAVATEHVPDLRDPPEPVRSTSAATWFRRSRNGARAGPLVAAERSEAECGAIAVGQGYAVLEVDPDTAVRGSPPLPDRSSRHDATLHPLVRSGATRIGFSPRSDGRFGPGRCPSTRVPGYGCAVERDTCGDWFDDAAGRTGHRGRSEPDVRRVPLPPPGRRAGGREPRRAALRLRPRAPVPVGGRRRPTHRARRRCWCGRGRRRQPGLEHARPVVGGGAGTAGADDRQRPPTSRRDRRRPPPPGRAALDGCARLASGAPPDRRQRPARRPARAAGRRSPAARRRAAGSRRDAAGWHGHGRRRPAGRPAQRRAVRRQLAGAQGHRRRPRQRSRCCRRRPARCTSSASRTSMRHTGPRSCSGSSTPISAGGSCATGSCRRSR